MGTWWQPLNANFGATGNMFGNVATIALTNSPVTLTTPPNSGASWAGPYQSQSAVLRFTGALTGNCAVTVPVPGFFIAENLCSGNNSFYVFLTTGLGKTIGLPPGQAVHVYSDGTDMKFVDLPPVGSYLDIAKTSLPLWIIACTQQPYLNCDGSTFNATNYPALNEFLGGNTLPDIRGTTRASLNQGTSRITTAGSGLDGNTLFSVGGSQLTQVHAHANTLNDLGHTHNLSTSIFYRAGGVNTQSGSPFQLSADSGVPPTGPNNSTPMSITNVTYGSGNSQNMPPTTIAGLTLIRAA